MKKCICGTFIMMIVCLVMLTVSVSAAEVASGTCGANGDNLT